MAIAIFAWLFHRFPLAQVVKSIGQVKPHLYIPLAVGYFLYFYMIDTLVTAKFFSRLGYPITFRELLPVRGVTYLIMILNYPASQAAFAYYLKRTHSIPFFSSLGFFFFLNFIDFFWLIALGFIGSFFQEAVIFGISLSSILQRLGVAAFAVLILNYFFWRKNFSISILRWIHSKKIFEVFKKTRWPDYLWVGAWRFPIHVGIMFTMYFVFQTFDAHVPLGKILTSIPITYLVGALPITPGGLGTTNTALVELLHPYLTGSHLAEGGVKPQELILAISLLWMATNYLLKAITGLVCLQKVARGLFKPA